MDFKAGMENRMLSFCSKIVVLSYYHAKNPNFLLIFETILILLFAIRVFAI